MFSGLQEDQVKAALEAMLFVTDEPVSTITLADMLEVEPSLVECTLVDLRAHLEEENRGIQLREVAGGWRLFTHPAYHELIERYVVSWDTRRLSPAAVETLAIIAYSQPVTRLGVAAVRGVNSDSSINSLIEKGLVREAGFEDSPGNPALFATTRTFLEKFGLRTVDDLPDIESFAPDDEARGFIRERLSVTRKDGTDLEGQDPGEREGAEGPPDLTGGLAGAGAGLPGWAGLAGATAGGGGDGGGATAGAAGAGVAEADGDVEANGDAEAADSGRAQDLLAQALAAGLGAVEKIDFDDLHFEE
ncbi:MAG: SMC-Scp complex subunit ScpB [Eggerthellaceae bacterium]|nr:SMC-Scp complex subunit ScpB [Eggerthellaceae bacterium]